ncbi:MAG: hypothetical protein GY839_07085 [candidate division Zixibacteria bacterium]|nr:hypothetical protein [candidate division Zixibacteria bacterium]
MKKTLILIVVFASAAAFIAGCDQQKALDQILEKPEMKSYLMSKMMEDDAIKTEITNQLLADSAWVTEAVGRLTGQISNRALMFEELMKHDGMADMMLEKMAEDNDLKAKMKEIGRRR